MPTSTVCTIIPTYNQDDFLGDAIESVLAQAWRPQQILIVDDGSSDETSDVVKAFGPQVEYVYQDHRGLPAARNHGIARARCNWVAFLDSDDYWDGDHLQQLMSMTSVPGAVFVYSGNRWVTADKTPIATPYSERRYLSGWVFEDLFLANHIPSHATLVARSALVAAGGFDESFTNAEDYEMWLRLAARHPVCSVALQTVNYRRHPGNMTGNPMARAQGVLRALEKAYELYGVGAVDPRNTVDPRRLRSRLRDCRVHVASTLFTNGAYRELRSFGARALWRGSLSGGLMTRWALAFLPPSVVDLVVHLSRAIRPRR